MTTTDTDSTRQVEDLIAGRIEIPLAEFADLRGIPRGAARERHRRGTLGVEVRQAKPSRDGKRGSSLVVPASEVRRYAAGITA